MRAGYRGGRAWTALAMLADAAARTDLPIDVDARSTAVVVYFPDVPPETVAAMGQITDDLVMQYAERILSLWAERAQGGPRSAPRFIIPSVERACRACGMAVGQACQPMHDGERDAGDWCHPERLHADVAPFEVPVHVLAWARDLLWSGSAGDGGVSRTCTALVDLHDAYVSVKKELQRERALRGRMLVLSRTTSENVSASAAPALTALSIGHCGNCPFADDDSNGWTCTADYDFETGNMAIDYGRALQPNQVPPDWCRLRREDVLVQLTPAARGVLP